MNTTLLSRTDLTETLEIIHSLVQCHNTAELIPICSQLESLTGCDNITLAIPELLDSKKDSLTVKNKNYPLEWVALSQQNKYWRVNQKLFLSHAENASPYWVDAYHRSPADKECIKLAYDFMIYEDGYICLTSSIAGDAWSIIPLDSLLSKKTTREDYILGRIVPHFQTALLSINKRHKANRFSKPTPREKEVLKWLYQGKTSWEISVILNVAEATINFHIKNIKNKFHAVSRSQAVAKAVHYGLISL